MIISEHQEISYMLMEGKYDESPNYGTQAGVVFAGDWNEKLHKSHIHMLSIVVIYIYIYIVLYLLLHKYV